MINATAEVPDTADREDIRGELHRILDAPQFNHSPVMRRLLSFLVEQTLAGIGHRLKAYTIAAAALVPVLVGLFAWQALGGLARADIDKPRTQSSAETGDWNEAYRRCAKVVAADQCRGMLARYDDPGAI